MRPYSQPFKIGEIDFVLVEDHYGDFRKKKARYQIGNTYGCEIQTERRKSP
jgi:hypothetical protein